MPRDLCTRAILLPCGVKNVLNRSFTIVNSLLERIFPRLKRLQLVPGNKIISRAKASPKQKYCFAQKEILFGW